MPWPDVALHQVWSLIGLGEKDDALPTGLGLAMIFGTFFLNADVAIQKRNQAKSNAKIWGRATTSDAHQAVFLNSKTFWQCKKQFPNDGVWTLKEFLAFLAGQGMVDPHVECHKVLH